jgi:hypothetical protein
MSLEEYDSFGFRAFTLRSEMDKALHVFEGIIKGIAIDGIITNEELAELQNWHELHQHLLDRPTFYEIITLLKQAGKDGYITLEEREDILWLCNSFKPTSEYYNVITNDIQQLHGIMHGILSDNRIDLLEVQNLDKWLSKSDHLKGVYPYDELCSSFFRRMSLRSSRGSVVSSISCLTCSISARVDAMASWSSALSIIIT